MIEKPIVFVGQVAAKVQAVATNVALKAAKVSEALARKAANIQARAAARAALKALPRKPSVEFLREVGHGRTTLSFYRVTNHRAGTVRNVWGLNRVKPDGRRVRLVTGSMDELRSLRNILGRSLAPESRPRQVTVRQPRPTERAKAPRQRHASESQRAEERPEPTRWYALVYVENVAPNGLATGRVVRNFRTSEEAHAHQKQNPNTVVLNQATPRPRPQGEVVTMRLGPKAAPHVGEDRRNGQKLEGPKVAVSQPALRQQRRQALSQ